MQSIHKKKQKLKRTLTVKRGLRDFVGKTIKFLFGTMDSEDEQKN